MKPTEKHSTVDAMIQELFGVDRRKAICENTCALCGASATQFRDDLSRREFSISGMCQHCQDRTFE